MAKRLGKTGRFSCRIRAVAAGASYTQYKTTKELEKDFREFEEDEDMN